MANVVKRDTHINQKISIIATDYCIGRGSPFQIREKERFRSQFCPAVEKLSPHPLTYDMAPFVDDPDSVSQRRN
jgi:hypothetical protein